MNTAAHILEVSHHLLRCRLFHREKVSVQRCIPMKNKCSSKHYIKTMSFKRAQKLFQNWFPNSRMPNKSTIQRNVEYFCTPFLIANGYIGQQLTPTMLTPKKITEVRDHIHNDPMLPTYHLSTRVGVSAYSIRTVLKHWREFSTCCA